MKPLGDIPLAVEYRTGNVRPLLAEIRHALERLVDTGEPTAIDLRSMPLAPGEEEALLEALGEGEVRAELHALGPSEITETAISGVWLVTHRNASGEIAGQFIEVTRMPQILESQEADMLRGMAILAEKLASPGTDTEGNH